MYYPSFTDSISLPVLKDQDDGICRASKLIESAKHFRDFFRAIFCEMNFDLDISNCGILF